MGMSVVDKLNALSGEMESLLDFIAKDETLGDDFQTYVDENGIKIEKQSQLNIVLVEYLLDGKMQDGLRVLDYYTSKGGQKNDFVIEALKKSATSVFEIKKVLKNAYETYSLTAEKEFCLIPLVKMVNLRGISRGDFIRARVIEMENEYYLLEIYDVISSLNFYRAASDAIKCMISNSKSAVFKNDEKKEKLEKSVVEFKNVFEKRFKGYDYEKIITTNKLADKLLAALSDDCEIKDLIEQPQDYKYFEVAEFKSEDDFVQNAIGGFSKHNCTYDVGFYFDDSKGLFVVPFLGTFYKIFEQDVVVEGAKECIREFLKSDKVPYGVIEHVARKYPNFLEVINLALDTNFGGTLEVLEKFKGKKELHSDTFSPITVLYNSKVFSDLLGFEQEPQKPQVQAVGRNEPCPCGSGKKFKHCCGAN